MVEDCIQDLDSVTCGIFQIYFYDKSFNRNENSKIQNKAKLNKKAIEILLKELFNLDDQQQNVTTPTTMTSQSHDLPVPETTSIYLLDIVDFGQVKINDIT